METDVHSFVGDQPIGVNSLQLTSQTFCFSVCLASQVQKCTTDIWDYMYVLGMVSSLCSSIYNANGLIASTPVWLIVLLVVIVCLFDGVGA